MKALLLIEKDKTGKSLLNEINIKSYKDISKIVVGENTQEDVSWVEPIQTITFTNKDDIDYLYNQLSQLKTLNKSGADDENEVEAPKKANNKIGTRKCKNMLLHYKNMKVNPGIAAMKLHWLMES